MSKPRTNDQACEYWARSILDNEFASEVRVNSIIVEHDVVYSFGYHYPMGVIVRDSNGRPKYVVITDDYYPSRGFASTPTDQGSVRTYAYEYARERGIEVRQWMLSAYKTAGLIRIRPSDDDPEPAEFSRREVPRRFHASDPGPEPVKSNEGCIAGTRYGVSTYERTLVWAKDLDKYSDRPIVLDEEPKLRTGATAFRARHLTAWLKALLEQNELLWVRTWKERWTAYGEDSYQHGHGAGTYEQCPHCKEFEQRRRAWHERMYGHGWYDNGKGWSGYEAALHAYGSWDGWLAAYQADGKRVYAAQKARREWVERNTMPFDEVPRKRGARVPDLDVDGYPLKKHVESWHKRERQRARVERQLEREAEERLRHQRQLAQFRERMRARRIENNFVAAAESAAAKLAATRERLEQAHAQ